VVTGSSPDKAIAFFNLSNPSSRTMALGFPHSAFNRNEYQMNISGGEELTSWDKKLAKFPSRDA
jgi:hypothetical protein